MAKLTLSDLSNLQNEQSAVAAINSNSTAIETAFENTLSRDGTSPNTMSADLDMNSNNILNLPYPASATEPVRLSDVSALIPYFYQQASAPSTSVTAGSMWIDSDSTDLDLYQLISGSWTDTGVNLKGATGSTGATGPANTLTIGTVNSGAAAASITGTAPNQVLNLTLQTGSTGATGATGPSINVYVQTSAPSTSGVPESSLWIDSDDSSKLYKLTSGIWVDQGVQLKGADGAGTGDASTNTSSSVDSEIVLFSGTGGKTLKRASSTGILKAASGVIGTAASGTDYAPATSGSSILKGSGSGGFSNASAGTDYVAPSGALGTPSSGTLTNCTSLPVAGITASTSTALGVGSIELGHATDTTLSRSAAGILAVEGTPVVKAGKHTVWVPASSMTPNTTNGAATGTVEMTTNKNMFNTLDFDTTTQEFAQFEVFLPKSWDLGTVTFIPVWSHASTSTNFGVVWGLCGVARSDDDAGDVAFGTAQTSTDTGGTTNDIYIGPESSAITIAGSPATGDTVQFRVQRNPSDGSDTMAIDARLHGIKLLITTNAATDA